MRLDWAESQAPHNSTMKHSEHVSHVICLLSVAFAASLANTASAQNAVSVEQVKTPITVEIASQLDSPLHVSLVGVDETDERVKKISLTLQNVTERTIRGFVIATNYGNVGGETTISFFPSKPRTAGSSSEVLTIAGENTRLSPNLTVFIDYVLFTDGTAWGADIRKNADLLSGNTGGAYYAANKFSELIKLGPTSLDDILAKPTAETEVELPPEAENQSEAWRRGFRSGYKGFIHFVKVHHGDPDFVTQLGDYRSQLGKEQRAK